MVHHTIIKLRKEKEELVNQVAAFRHLYHRVEKENITLRREISRLKRQVFALNTKGPRIKALVG